MPNKVWNEITYPFTNLNGGNVNISDWISNFIPHFIMDVIVLGLNFSHVSTTGVF